MSCEMGDSLAVAHFLVCEMYAGGEDMIDVTRMNGSVVSINNDLIETVEETPDTVITLTTGKKIIVKESRQEVKNLVKCYKKEISCNF